MKTLETIKKLYKKFPNLTVKELIDILDCIDLKEDVVYNQPLKRDPFENIILHNTLNDDFKFEEAHLKDVGKFKCKEIFDRNTNC